MKRFSALLIILISPCYLIASYIPNKFDPYFEPVFRMFQTLSDTYEVSMPLKERLDENGNFTKPDFCFDDITRPFGIRYNFNKYDWHRGIDIHSHIGTPIYAVLPGRLHSYRFFDKSGWCVRLEHDIPDQDLSTPEIDGMYYRGQVYKHFYSWYCHLNKAGTDAIIKKWSSEKEILSGQLIAKMGGTGSFAKSGPHLHFELRFGEFNSLQYQKENYKKVRFDPHVNPLILYQPYKYGSESYNIYLKLLNPLSTGKNIELQFSTTDDMPAFNRLIVEVFNKKSKGLLKAHILDLNTREGFNANAGSASLDKQDRTNPYIEPDLGSGRDPISNMPAFSIDGDTYFLKFIIPSIWLSSLHNSQNEIQVHCADTWGNVKTIKFNL